MKKIIDFAVNLIAKYPLVWQFAKFCTVGLTNLALYMAIYWCLTRKLSWHYIPASVAGFVIAVTWSFYFNLKWTFKGHGGNRQKQYVAFFTANLISLGINLALLTLFIEIFKIYDILAQLISSVICAFINFGLNRFWAFRKR